MSFQPAANQDLLIDGVVYHIAEHPAAPGMPYGQEGRQAIVYQLVAQTDRRALKVFKPRYRTPALVSLAERLATFAALPGLAVCRRTVLTPQRHGDILRQHPDLIYAVLMPWVEGPTWMELLLGKQCLSPEQCLALARALAEILSLAEQRGVAHCDVSGSNVLLPALAATPKQGGRGMVALVDVEQLYGPGLERPALLPGGSPGYAHKTAPAGLWGPDADRFAGAVLLAEMLGWCDERVRQAAWGENYFEPPEMQQESARSRTLAQVLRERWGEEVAGLFERAWQSSALADCATFGEWLMMLPEGVPAIRPVAAAATSAPAADADATVRALVEAAHSLERQGNLAGALEVYRRAQTLMTPGSGYAQELTLIVGGLEEKLRTPPAAPSPGAARAAARAAGPDLAHLFDEGRAAYAGKEWARAKELLSEVVRQQPHYERNGQRATELLAEVENRRATPARPRRRWGWGWTVGLLVLLFLGSIGVLWSLGQQGRGPLAAFLITPTLIPTSTSRPTSTPTFTPTPTSTPAPAAIRPENADRVQETRTFTSQGGLETVAFSPDGTVLAWGGWGGIWLYDLVHDRELYHLTGHTAQVHKVVFNADGTRLYSGGVDSGGGRVRAWDVQTGTELWSAVVAPDKWGTFVGISPDQQWLVSGGALQVTLWRLNDNGIDQPTKLSSSAGTAIFSPDSRWVAFWEMSGGVKLVRIEDGETRWLEAPGASTYSPYAAFSPDASMVAAGAYDGVVRLWRVSDGTLLRTFEGHTDWIWTVAFSPDGTILASGGKDRTIRLWDVSNGTLLSTLEGHTGVVNSLAFSPDGTLLASGAADDKTVWLWGVR